MKSNKCKYALFAALLIPIFSVRAFVILDSPAAALEPGLEADDNYEGILGWINNDILLVTAKIGAESKFWEKKVVAVNVKSGEIKDLFNPGHLLCVNSSENAAGVAVGSEAYKFVSSAEPAPEVKTIEWSKRKNSFLIKNSGENWNKFLCKYTKSELINEQVASEFYFKQDAISLELRHEQIKFARKNERFDGQYFYIKNGKEEIPLNLKKYELTPTPQYLPFNNKYILSPGFFSTEGPFVRNDYPKTEEAPLITMTSSGEINREYFLDSFKNSGLHAFGMTIPYAKGFLTLVSGRAKDGAGIYITQDKSIKRIWCTNDAGQPGRKCILNNYYMAPSGCHLAFFTKGSDSYKSSINILSRTLKILPLCN